MKKFIIGLVLLLAPASYSASTPDVEKLGKAMKLNCKTFGSESGTSRFIAVSACTFSYGIAKSDKTVKESLDIADDLFVLLMRGNGLNPNDMFDQENHVKESIFFTQTLLKLLQTKKQTDIAFGSK